MEKMVLQYQLRSRVTSRMTYVISNFSTSSTISVVSFMLNCFEEIVLGSALGGLGGPADSEDWAFNN